MAQTEKKWYIGIIIALVASIVLGAGERIVHAASQSKDIAVIKSTLDRLERRFDRIEKESRELDKRVTIIEATKK